MSVCLGSSAAGGPASESGTSFTAHASAHDPNKPKKICPIRRAHELPKHTENDSGHSRIVYLRITKMYMECVTQRYHRSDRTNGAKAFRSYTGNCTKRAKYTCAKPTVPLPSRRFCRDKTSRGLVRNAIRNSFTNEKRRNFKIVRAGCNVPAGGHGRREQATKQQAESKLLRDTDKLYISSYVTCTACTTLGNNFEIRCHGRHVRSQKPEIWRDGFAL